MRQKCIPNSFSEPLDNYDSYVDTVYSMGLDDVLEIQEAALDRYNARTFE